VLSILVLGLGIGASTALFSVIHAILIRPLPYANGENLVVVRQFFMNIPTELIDAAMMDGANPFQIFWQIMLPLSKAVLAVVALFYGVALWSDYFQPLLYISNTAMWPIPLVLRLYVLQGQALSGAVQVGQPLPPATTVQMAVVVIATVPILVVYPFLQRYFTQGVLAGAIKG